MSWVTLLTDFGRNDYYIGAMTGTLLRLAPGAHPVHLSHEIPPGDLELAADLLAGAAPTFPAGTIHCAVVDPGVGTSRRILAVSAQGQRFVAPDNGLLEPFLASPGSRVVAVDRPDLYLPGPGSTFHGRDRFVPVAAALARGIPLDDLGAPIADPVRLHLPLPRRVNEAHSRGLVVARGRVVRIDHFGNLVTDLPAAWLDASDTSTRNLLVELLGDGGEHLLDTDRRVTCYGDLAAGEPGFLVGSRDTLELSLRDDSLARRLGLGGTARERRALAVRLVDLDPPT